jgi:ATP-binding cassette subfamily F protein uup
MSKYPILSLRKIKLSFAKKILFEDLDLNIFARDRICLIGKNGIGKTTLLNTIANEFEIDQGERFQMPNTVLGYLRQNEKLADNLTIEEFINREIKLDEQKKYLIEIICSNLKIDKNLFINQLSGGQARRVNLAKALILQPDILLLDEPTNHLDIEVIEWLEQYLSDFQGALVVISHDRKFLEKISNKVFWIRSGQIKINNHGYKNFDQWSNNIIEQEQRELENLQKKVELESSWLQTGVTGRRKRNIGRLHHLQELKLKLSNQQKIVFANHNKINLAINKFQEDGPEVIVSFNNLGFELENNQQKIKLIDKFNLKIIRKERIGIIGKNGSGKSTLLKLIIGEIDPSSGNIKRARDFEYSYFDQNRSAITAKKTVQEILCENGSDYVLLANGKTKHICGYLSDFAFNPDDKDTLASTLSGGQQNRLLLAKTLANPKNFLILDEPTNDLDMDSLDILQDYLEEYQGTLVVVSHDRDFLDNIATTILAFEGNQIITVNYGSYTDYINYKNKYLQKNQDNNSSSQSINVNQNKQQQKFSKENIKVNDQAIIFSYKMQLELDKIPEKISQINLKIQQLNLELSNLEEYNPNDYANISFEINQHQKQLEILENRWLELEEIKEKNQQ